MFGITVNVNLPICLGQPHFLLKIDHTACGRQLICIAVQHEHFCLNRVRFRWYRRTQNAVQREHASYRSSGTRQLKNTTAPETIANGCDAIFLTFRPASECMQASKESPPE